MKNEAGLRPMKRGFATRRSFRALRFTFRSRNASWQRSYRFISHSDASFLFPLALPTDLWYNRAKKGGVSMINQFTVSFERISDESATSYLIGFQKNDIKDIAIQFLKLQYRKIDKMKFCDNKKSIVVEFVNQARFLLVIDGHTIILSQTNIEVITSFLLDATEEYMNYDHIDFEFPTEKIDLCFMRILYT